MKVTVRLFGPFRLGRFKEEARELPPGATPRAVAAELGLPLPLLGTTLVNGLHADLDAALSDGDELTILPILEGG